MESNQHNKAKEIPRDFSTVESTIAYLLSKGAKLSDKKGAILMPLSKKQKESMTHKENLRPSNEK